MKRTVSVVVVVAFSVSAIVAILLSTRQQLKPASTSSVKAQQPPIETLESYTSKLLNITFKHPSKFKIIEETNRELVMGTNEPELYFSKVEDVPIRLLRACSLSETSDACLYDSYRDQAYFFNDFELDGKDAKGFYYRDKGGKDWHIVSLSVYEEFQIKMLAKHDADFAKILDSFDFLNNND